MYIPKLVLSGIIHNDIYDVTRFTISGVGKQKAEEAEKSVVLLFVKTVPLVSLKLYISYYTYLEELYINTKVYTDSVLYT